MSDQEHEGHEGGADLSGDAASMEPSIDAVARAEHRLDSVRQYTSLTLAVATIVSGVIAVVLKVAADTSPVSTVAIISISVSLLGAFLGYALSAVRGLSLWMDDGRAAREMENEQPDPLAGLANARLRARAHLMAARKDSSLVVFQDSDQLTLPRSSS